MVLLAAAIIVTVGVGVATIRRHGAKPGAQAVAAVPTTIAYSPRGGPGGTTILTETVDPLSVAVPNGWKAVPADAQTLPTRIDDFAKQAPSLATLLQAQSAAAVKAAIRLFAYRPAPPFAFISVLSYSSPGAVPLTPATVTAVVAAAKKVPNVALSGEQLPVGEVLKFDSSPATGGQHLVVEVRILVSAGRTLLIEMASEVSAAGIPPLFGQLATSLSQK
ncbi:MAG TPA: hypothetical protein VHT75_16695 [Acidimicrobiales bacterium]|nr:hypothetical protein [Acidimicrobiales bacterium]